MLISERPKVEGLTKSPENLIQEEVESNVKDLKEGIPFEKEALTIRNNELLEKSTSQRLSYVTKLYISGDKLLENLEKGSTSITFSFNKKENRELFMKTTAGQVLPKEVGTIVLNDVEFSRKSLKGEFFDENNNRLIIKDGTKIFISKSRNGEIIESTISDNQKKALDYIKSNSVAKENQDIVLEAINRGIDPKFALVGFTDKFSNLKGKERDIAMENSFTEFDRQRGYVKDSGNLDKTGKYSLGMIFALFKKLFSGDIKGMSKLLEGLGYDKEEIKSKRSENIPNMLSESKKQEILGKAPESLKELVRKYFPAEEFENALFVCYYESSFDKNAVNDKNKNGSVDRGYFQINSIHKEMYAGRDIFNPEVNVEIAGRIFARKQLTNSPDWSDWYAARNKVGLWA